ncbi:hypothetical protein DV738_g347, partial [Chaetothyriales sp. CBS 135597]
MSFQTVQYVPPSRKDSIQQKEVIRIFAVAHEQQAWGQDKLTNHWCLYLQTSGDTSVCVDMSPSHTYPSTRLPGGSKGILVVSELADTTIPKNATKVTEIQPLQELRVQHIIDALTEAGHDRYEFDHDGVGCRLWVSSTLALLQTNGYGDSGQIQEAQAAIRKLWPDETSLELDAGAFF